MKLSRLIFLPALTAGLAFSAPSREIVELQRDVASLTEQVRHLQRSIDEKMGSLDALMQQSIASSNKGNTSLAVLESGIRDRLAEQQKNLVAPVLGMGTKLDQMATEFQGVRESVADLTERMNKLQAQMVDLNNAVRTLQAPPSPPPATGVPGASSGSTTPPPGLSAKQLYDTSMKDRSGGNLDLALQGFDEYLKYFSDTELAPNAQFYVGQIYYDKNDFANAIRAFDAVLERFPENNKTSDAMYMKGMALLKSTQRNEAAQEFLTLIQKYPNSDVAAKARQQRRALGLSVPSAPAASKRSRR
jgi:tol-pal system protein YbgF